MSLFAVASLVASGSNNGKSLILKVVNMSAPLKTSVTLQGIKKIVPLVEPSVLPLDSVKDEDTFECSNNIIPRSTKVAVKATVFERTFPANFVTIVCLKTG